MFIFAQDLLDQRLELGRGQRLKSKSCTRIKSSVCSPSPTSPCRTGWDENPPTLTQLLYMFSSFTWAKDLKGIFVLKSIKIYVKILYRQKVFSFWLIFIQTICFMFLQKSNCHRKDFKEQKKQLIFSLAEKRMKGSSFLAKRISQL